MSGDIVFGGLFKNAVDTGIVLCDAYPEHGQTERKQ
jgi:hypothetical protein